MLIKSSSREPPVPVHTDDESPPNPPMLPQGSLLPSLTKLNDKSLLQERDQTAAA